MLCVLLFIVLILLLASVLNTSFYMYLLKSLVVVCVKALYNITAYLSMTTCMPPYALTYVHPVSMLPSPSLSSSTLNMEFLC